MHEREWEREYADPERRNVPYADVQGRNEQKGRSRRDEEERYSTWESDRSAWGTQRPYGSWEGDEGPYGEPYPGAPSRRSQWRGQEGRHHSQDRPRGGRAGWDEGRGDWREDERRMHEERWRRGELGPMGLMGPGLGSPGFAGMGAGMGPASGTTGWPGEPGATQGWGSTAHHTGRYAGRGPKGYQRSRERILDDVCEALTRDSDVDASGIEVDVDGDVVVLRGRVLDRSQKRTAEDIAESASGVRDVRNELEVEKGMVQELTDAITGRGDEETGDRRASPSRARTSSRS